MSSAVARRAGCFVAGRSSLGICGSGNGSGVGIGSVAAFLPFRTAFFATFLAVFFAAFFTVFLTGFRAAFFCFP